MTKHINQIAHKYLAQSKKYKSMDKEGNYVPASETELQNAVIRWLQQNYPHVRVSSTLNGVALSKRQAMIASKQQTHRGVPDLIIHHPNDHFPILYLELKKDGTRLRKRDGSLYNDHIMEQAAYIYYLRDNGYCADFSVGYVDTIIKLRTYLENDVFTYTL